LQTSHKIFLFHNQVSSS